MAGELPGKRLGDLLVVLPESEKAFGQLIEVGQVVGSEHLALHDREVDLDLALSQEACLGRWMRRKLGHYCPCRRLTDLSPRWEEPLSTIQKTVSAEA